MVLNMAILPSIILILSNMIILEQKLSGYNNALTLATKDMKFGINEEVNYQASEATQKVLPTPHNEEMKYILASALVTGFMLC